MAREKSIDHVFALFWSDAGFTNGFEVVYNTSTCAVSSDASFGAHTLVSESTLVVGSWCKMWVTGSILSSVTQSTILVALASGNSTSYSGDGASNDLVYGPSLTAGTTVP